MIAIDKVGTTYTPGTYDAQGEVITAPVAKPGFFVIASAAVPGWTVSTEPAARVFGGVDTINYQFADEEEADAAIEAADLSGEPVAPASPKPPLVSVITYKLLFTSAERIATKASTDPVIVDLQDLMNDPRTTHVDLSLQSISDALDYMTHLGLIAAGRKAEILTGVIR